MKRIFLLTTVAALFLTVQALVNCSSPLEGIPSNENETPEPPVHIYDTVFDTLIIIDSTGADTVVVIDTVVTVDTVITNDTIDVGDTVFVPDTVIEYDTVVVVDTTVDWDTVVVIDTTVIVDTTVVVDTVIDTDTIVQTDTVIQNDTTVVHDTVVVPDTVTVPDTVIVPDTIYITDTVTVVDTIYIMVPDTSDSPVMCAQLGPTQKEIVWMLRNEEGEYHLEFSGRIEKEHPSNTVTVDINGHEYTWDVGAEPVLVIDKWLTPNSVIVIKRIKPNPFGHDIDICVSISRP